MISEYLTVFKCILISIWNYFLCEYADSSNPHASSDYGPYHLSHRNQLEMMNVKVEITTLENIVLI